jgi:hypothetical protein
VIGELTVMVDPDERESVPSYLLRCFAANRVRPHEVYRWLGLRWTGYLEPEHVPTLATVTRSALPWLRSRVAAPVPDAHGQLAWAGWRWRRTRCMRRAHHQLCPLCIHAEGIGRLEWELDFVPVCARHRRLLIDHCPVCGASIGWQRPSIDVCRCKRYFRPRAEDDKITLTEDVEYWLQWLIDSIRWRGSSGLALPSELAAVLPGAPSPDGVWRVLHAFGVRPVALPNNTGVVRRSVRLGRRETLDLVGRGFHRLRRMERLDVGDEVHTGALRLQTVCGVTSGDRLLAKHLLSRVLPGRSDAAMRGRQLELFE